MKKTRLIITMIVCVLLSVAQTYAAKHTVKLCNSSKLEIAVKPQGTAPFTYKWYKDSVGVTIEITTNESSSDSIFLKSSVVATDSGYYYCLITDGHSCTNYSDTIEVKTYTQPVITQNDFYLCEGGTATLTLAGSYTGGSWSAATGVHSTITSDGGVITPDTNDNTAKFYYTDTHGGACTCRDSVTVTVINKPSVTITDNSLTICEGSNTDIIATGKSDPATTPSYQWFATSSDWSTRNSNLGTSATQNTGALSIAGTTADSTFYYKVIVTNASANGGCPADSATAQVLVRVSPTVTIADVAAICEGGSTTMTATSSSANYTWYACTNSGTSIGSSIGTSNTQTTGNLNIAGNDNDSTFYYKVIVQNTNGSTCPKDSATIDVTVYVTPTVTITPNVTSICENGTINLSSTVSTTSNNTYQWYTTNVDGTTEFSTLGTSNTQTYLTNVSGTTDTLVYFKLAVKHQGCTAVISNIAKDTVHPRPELAAISDQTICSGSNCTYIFTGNIPTGTTYSWTIGTDNDNITGQADGSGSSFSTANLYNSDTDAQHSISYTISPIVTATGCEAASTSSLTVNVQPSISSTIYVNGVEQ